MGRQLRFDDKVVIVTGAGNGLGRAHALLFASRGAKVVVNDLGGSAFGDGADSRAADKVVAEIREAGGEAVANYDSVEDGTKVVQTALDTWGRVDVVINNAGILRDSSFHKMSEKDWDLIYRVHVLGSYRVTAAAWPHMRAQGYGRIIMTSSGAGIYGNFGQANYGMAKMGLVGLASTLAVEGAKKGIHVNSIAPIAGSRLTETVLPKEITDALAPELVSPLVAYLAHESCEENGGLFEVGGGFFAKLRWERTGGHTTRLGREVSVETVKNNWESITSFAGETDHPPMIAAAMAPVLDNINAGPSLGGNDIIDVDLALGYEFPEDTTTYDERDLALYALGVGAANDPSDTKDLQLVYERHNKGFRALPTYGVIPPMNAMIDRAIRGEKAPGLNYGPERLLHGEQFMEVFYPLPAKATLTHRARVKDIWDKGKGAIVNVEAKSYDEEGNLLIRNEFISFIRGAGGFGGERGPSAKINIPPERAPDVVTEESIGSNQAILYRLSGDWNPLHIDPGFAMAFGFDKPILHGLCTFGYATRHVINAFSGGDTRYFKSIKVRFTDSVFPGETLITEMWKETDQRILFQCRVKEREKVVLSNAAIELHTEIPKKPEPAPEPAAGAEDTPPAEPTSADIFNGIGAYVAEHPELVGKVGKSFQFSLTDPASAWVIDLSSGSGSVKAGAGTADCTLTLSDADFMDMVAGKADAQKMYFGGQLQIGGDMMAAQKLTFLTKIPPEAVRAAMAARGASGGGDTAEPEDGGTADIFLGIGAYVAANPELATKLGTSFGFKLTEPESAWTVDLKTGAGRVSPGLADNVDCTLELSDANFLAMCLGEADPQKMYFGGELQISGNVMASQKLSFLQTIDQDWMRAEVAKLKAAGNTMDTSAATAPVVEKVAQAPGIFAAITERIGQNPGLLAELGATVHIIVDGGAPFAIGDGEPTTTLTLTDDDFGAWAAGDATPQDLFQRGKLRIDGAFAPVHRLGFITAN